MYLTITFKVSDKIEKSIDKDCFAKQLEISDNEKENKENIKELLSCLECSISEEIKNINKI